MHCIINSWVFYIMKNRKIGDWICHDCGTKYGKLRTSISTWHNNTCDYCKQEKPVTESRDYGYPELPNPKDQILAVLGFDLDTTLLDSSLVEVTARELGYNFTQKDIQDWYFSTFPNDLKEAIIKRFYDPYFMCDPKFNKPVNGANKRLKELKKQGNKLILITARTESIRFRSRLLINKFFPSIHRVRFVEFGQSKEKIFKQEKLDYWIDDNPDDCTNAIKIGINTFMVCNEYTKYNHSIKGIKGLNLIKTVNDFVC